MIDRDALPPEVVEAAARVIYDRWRLRQGTPWDELGDSANYWRGWGSDALAAALSVGEVRQEWRVVYTDANGETQLWSQARDKDEATRYWAEAWGEGNWPDARKQSRTVVTWPDGTMITTPWKDVDLGEE